MASSEKDIFNEARDLAGSERAAYLDSACGSDAPLRARVEELLALHEGVEGFLSSPAGTSPFHIGDPLGAVIERYRIVHPIGEGGFGVVYLAEQEEPVRRRVALKIVKPGMDSAQVIARFEQERHALAMMDHPNIARVYDAGATPQGRPYFVMEHTDGEPINAYCDHRNLSIDDRLRLFAQVCLAVQRAHAKGVIHRDIKPSNVLVVEVDGVATPKVIDFGIAKALSGGALAEKTWFTELRVLIGTPEYMSPEQAELTSVDVDTRSDVYSLGVMLYELLTGAVPFDPRRLRSAAFGEILRIIREEEPARPSTRLGTLEARPTIAAHRRVEPGRLVKIIRGDLDWIVMKCLEKDRDRRYATADGVAADIDRHLQGQPVMAAPPSAVYRARKFVRRHRVGVGAAAAIGVVLLLGIIGTSAGMRWAMAEANRADREAAKARQVEESERARADELEKVSAFQSSQLAGIDAGRLGLALRQSMLDDQRESLVSRGESVEVVTPVCGSSRSPSPA